MPIYEYECQKCGAIIEVLQGFNDKPLEVCECGKKGKLVKIISLSSFHLKGNGWYVTDYARKTAQPPSVKQTGSALQESPSSGDGEAAGKGED